MRSSPAVSRPQSFHWCGRVTLTDFPTILPLEHKELAFSLWWTISDPQSDTMSGKVQYPDSNWRTSGQHTGSASPVLHPSLTHRRILAIRESWLTITNVNAVLIMICASL